MQELQKILRLKIAQFVLKNCTFRFADYIRL